MPVHVENESAPQYNIRNKFSRTLAAGTKSKINAFNEKNRALTCLNTHCIEPFQLSIGNVKINKEMKASYLLKPNVDIVINGEILSNNELKNVLR